MQVGALLAGSLVFEFGLWSLIGSRVMPPNWAKLARLVGAFLRVKPAVGSKFMFVCCCSEEIDDGDDCTKLDLFLE